MARKRAVTTQVGRDAKTGRFIPVKDAKRRKSTTVVETIKCYRLFRPKFSKVKTSFVAQIRQVSNTLTPSAGVCDYTPV